VIHGSRILALHAVPIQYSIFGLYGLSTAHTAGQRYTKPWSRCATCSLASVRSYDSRSRKGRLVTRRHLFDPKRPRRLRALGSGSRQAASQGLSYICFDGWNHITVAHRLVGVAHDNLASWYVLITKPSQCDASPTIENIEIAGSDLAASKVTSTPVDLARPHLVLRPDIAHSGTQNPRPFSRSRSVVLDLAALRNEFSVLCALFDKVCRVLGITDELLVVDSRDCQTTLFRKHAPWTGPLITNLEHGLQLVRVELRKVRDDLNTFSSNDSRIE
jgi:hypothetical protein